MADNNMDLNFGQDDALQPAGAAAQADPFADLTASAPTLTFGSEAEAQPAPAQTAAESQPAVSEQPAPAEEYSVADEIRKLASLKEQGVLTEEEFTAKKKQLLGL